MLFLCETIELQIVSCKINNCGRDYAILSTKILRTNRIALLLHKFVSDK